MFNFFNKKKIEIPHFSFIEKSVYRDKYFARTKPWDWLNELQIYVVSTIKDQPAMITMDYWPQQIFQHANGQITVAELMTVLANQYVDSNMKVPKDFDKGVLEMLDELVNDLKVVEYCDQKTDLPKELALPQSSNITVN